MFFTFCGIIGRVKDTFALACALCVGRDSKDLRGFCSFFGRVGYDDFFVLYLMFYLKFCCSYC